MSGPTEEELFARVFELRPRLRALLRLYGVAPDDREDLLREAFLALWRKRAKVRDYEAWLLSALRMECLRHRRRGGRRIHLALDEACLERLAGNGGFPAIDSSHDLRQLVHRLPARHQVLLHLRYGLGLTPEETAARLGYGCRV